MEMQQICYFVALAQTLNFTRAAEHCNVSQPALTRAIQQLEHELGGPLFHRERNNTHLSELGRMMMPYLESVAESARAAKAAAASAKKAEHVTLTLGAMCTIGPDLIADLIVRFQAALGLPPFRRPSSKAASAHTQASARSGDRPGPA